VQPKICPNYSQISICTLQVTQETIAVVFYNHNKYINTFGEKYVQILYVTASGTYTYQYALKQFVACTSAVSFWNTVFQNKLWLSVVLL
jgi:hypothetical protein